MKSFLISALFFFACSAHAHVYDSITAAAESTYPDPNEYNNLTNWIFGKNSPLIP